jgi:hypothetical protein
MVSIVENAIGVIEMTDMTSGTFFMLIVAGLLVWAGIVATMLPY